MIWIIKSQLFVCSVILLFIIQNEYNYYWWRDDAKPRHQWCYRPVLSKCLKPMPTQCWWNRRMRLMGLLHSLVCSPRVRLTKAYDVTIQRYRNTQKNWSQQNAYFPLYKLKMLCETPKVPFVISHKLLNLNTAKHAFDEALKMCDLCYVRVMIS